MRQNISPLFQFVNKPAVLTVNHDGYKVAVMRYGQRLKVARGDRKQAWLSEISQVSQSLISQLENSETATGSEYTNRLARALGISPDWLADEIGDMIPDNTLNDAARQILTQLATLTEREQYKVARMVDAFSNDIDIDPPTPANHDIGKRKMEG